MVSINIMMLLQYLSILVHFQDMKNKTTMLKIYRSNIRMGKVKLQWLINVIKNKQKKKRIKNNLEI